MLGVLMRTQSRQWHHAYQLTRWILRARFVLLCMLRLLTLCFYSKLATVLSLNTRIHQMFCPILVNVCCAKQGFEAAGNHVETFSVCVIHLVKCILMYFLTNRVNFITLQLYHI